MVATCVQRLQTRSAIPSGNIDVPKSEAGERSVPVIPMVVQVLREYKLSCPKAPLGLAFPDDDGGVVARYDAILHGWHRAQIAAGVVAKDAAGRRVEPFRPKYAGLHALRHWFASWCLNRIADGGLEMPLKTLQARLGHATLAMTADTYGHLFPRGDSTHEMAKAQRLLLG